MRKELELRKRKKEKLSLDGKCPGEWHVPSRPDPRGAAVDCTVHTGKQERPGSSLRGSW